MAGPLVWNAEALWLELAPLLPGLTVEVAARADSSNTRLLERARSDATPCLLVAEAQTAGRGRLGRPWQSQAGASLTFSLALPLAPADWSGLSLAVGVALADSLEPLTVPPAGPARIGLKWPNDLWLLDAPGRGRKLGGVLIETVAVGTQRIAVVGVGLNVLPQPAASLDSGFACLRELQADVNAPGALASVAAPLLRALLRFEREGFAPFQPLFSRRDLLRGQAVRTTLADCPAGVAEGVDAQGALRLRVAGSLHRIVSGEVSVRPLPEGAPC